MTAAHELLERGYQVELYNKGVIPGGKARSMPVPDSGSDGRLDLPAEHGFRFFPSFYRHVTDTMRRIPFNEQSQGVFDNLVNLHMNQTIRFDGPPLVIPVSLPKTLKELIRYPRMMANFVQLGVPQQELAFFIRKMWQLWTSCPERRLAEYEKINWWDFIEADGKSPQYQNYLARGLTTLLVATKPRIANVASISEVGFRLNQNMLSFKHSSDRVLNGPTNEVWIQPWLDFLTQKGLKYFPEHEAEKVEVVGQKTSRIQIQDNSGHLQLEVTGDYYILALPVEITAQLITPEIISLDPHLKGIKAMTEMVEWMSGIMYYLNVEPSLPEGHITHIDSPWALSAISQGPVWRNYDLLKYGNGKVVTVLSVVISDWHTPGILLKKPASECTAEEIAQEVWWQLKKGFNHETHILRDEMIEEWFLDPDIQNNAQPNSHTNLEPLFINVADTWKFRPEARTRIPNLFITGDFVRTNTDMACMEAANESARRAVNFLLETSGSTAAPCQIWSWPRPWYLWPLIALDRRRFHQGLPWANAGFLPVLVHRILVRINRFLRTRVNSNWGV